MKNANKLNHKNSSESAQKVYIELVRPKKDALERAIKKSIEKNRKALEILAKR